MRLFSLYRSRAFRRALFLLGGTGLLMMVFSVVGGGDGYREAHAEPVAERTVYIVKRMADGGTGPFVSISMDGNAPEFLTVSTGPASGAVQSRLTTAGIAHTVTESVLDDGYALDGYDVIEDTVGNRAKDLLGACFPNGSAPLTGLTATANIPADGKSYIVCVQNRALRTVYIVKRMADGGTGPFVSISMDGNAPEFLTVSTGPASGAVQSRLTTAGIAHTVTESVLDDGYALDGYDVIEDTVGNRAKDLLGACFPNGSAPLTGLTATANIPADGKSYIVCVQNRALRTISIVKRMADGGTGPIVSIAVDDTAFAPLSVSMSSAVGSLQSRLTTAGIAHTVTEVLVNGYALDGYDVIEDTFGDSAKARLGACFPNGSAPLTGLTATANIPADGNDYLVCIQNAPVGTLTINKHVIANPKLIENGTFNLTLDGVTKAAGVADGGTTGPMYLHSGTYTVGETSASGPDLTHYTSTTVCVNANGALVANPVVLAVGDNVTCTITNTRIILDPLQLIVRKWDDPVANLSGTGGPVAGFLMTITGTSGPALGHTYSVATNGTGTAFFDNIEEGSWTVSEPASSPHWTVIGSTANGANPDLDASRDEPANQVTTAEGTTPYVDFYNQRLVNIHAFKIEVAAGGTTNGAGWTITVKGCGVTLSQPTDSNGVADFNDLQLCPSGYTVSENPLGKPSFVPAGPTSTVVHAVTPGATYTVGFENVQIVVGCLAGCAPAVQPPVTAPTPTATPPAPTPTATSPATPVASATPPAQPSPTDVVLGAKTPGPAASATPIAPSTGTGASGDDSAPTLLFVAGLLAVAGGLAVTLAARRRRAG